MEELSDPTKTQSEIQKQLIESNKLLHRFVSLKHVLIRGIFTGIGGSIGATILIAVLLWFLAQLQYIPFLGDITESFIQTIEQGTSIQPLNLDN